MSFNFNAPCLREGTSSFKWYNSEGSGSIAMTVADMDLPSPPAVIEALKRRLDHPVLGYTMPPKEAVDAVLNYLRESYGWEVDPGWLVWVPGLVCGLNIAVRACGGSEVVSFTPVYPPFLEAPGFADKKLTGLPLRLDKDQWSMDFDRFEESITGETGSFLFCSPHNPVGRVWTRKELEKIGEICLRKGITIISDEIHCDLILDQDKQHTPTATLSPELAENTITLMSPSKTYNIPGLGASFAVIPNRELRGSFMQVMRGIVPHLGVLSWAALEPSYAGSGEWLRELLNHLRKNRDLVEERVASLPGISMTHVEATYLAWIRVSELGIDNPHKHIKERGLELQNGAGFGDPDYLRLNFACPRPLLEEALDRLSAAVDKA